MVIKVERKDDERDIYTKNPVNHEFTAEENLFIAGGKIGKKTKAKPHLETQPRIAHEEQSLK